MKQLVILFLALMAGLSAHADDWDTLYPQIVNNIRQPQFTQKDYVITSFGAKPEASAAANQKAINKAIRKCSKKGGGRVIVPAGVWNTGAIRLESGVNLVVEKGATLQFVFQPELYPIVPTRWEGLDCNNLSPCIYAYQATDVAITGEGVIDGGGTNDTWWKWCGAPKYGWKEGVISQRNGARAELMKMAEESVEMKDRVFGPKTACVLSLSTSTSVTACLWRT